MGGLFSRRKTIAPLPLQLQEAERIVPITPSEPIEPELPAAKLTPEKELEQPSPPPVEENTVIPQTDNASLVVEDLEDTIEVRAASPEKEEKEEKEVKEVKEVKEEREKRKEVSPRPHTPPQLKEVAKEIATPGPAESKVDQCDPTHVKDDTGLEFKEAGPDTTLNDLFTACKLGEVDKVIGILDKEEDKDKAIDLQNARGMWGSTLLMVAIQYKHLSLAECLLVRDRVDTRAVNEKGASAFLYACVDNHNSIVRTLIEYEAEGRSFHDLSGAVCNGNDEDTIDPGGYMERSAKIYNALYDNAGTWTPLAVACANGNLELFVILLEMSPGGFLKWINRPFSVPVLVPLQESKMGEVSGLTPLMVLCAYGHTEFLHSVMDDDQYGSILDFQQVDMDGATVMHHAARGRDPAGTLKLMLQEESLSAEALARVSNSSKYTNVNGTKVTQMMLVQPDSLGYTPGHYLLSRRDIDCEIFSKMLYASREVSRLFSEPTTGTLYGDKSRVSLARYPIGSTMLHIATQRKNFKCAKMLVDYGANPLIRDGTGIDRNGSNVGSGNGSGSAEGRNCIDLARKNNRNGKSDNLVSLLEEAAMKFSADGKNSVTATDGGCTDKEDPPSLEGEVLEDLEREIDAESSRRSALERAK